MKVESVEAFPIKVKAEEKLLAGTVSYHHFLSVIVRAVCDGVEGWGEAMTRHDPKATAILVRYLAKRIEGNEFDGPAGAWDKIWLELRGRGHTRGTDVEALSGIEIALYDCYGKLRRRPVSKLVSSAAKSKVDVYAGSLFASRGSVSDQVGKVMEAGMKGAKIKVGFGPEEDEQILKQARRAWPEGMLVADANGAYDSKAALKACRLFRAIRLAWFEEPVLSDDWEGYRSLRGAGVPVGGGETWFNGDIAMAMKERLVDVLEPSVSRCGGIGVESEAGRLAAGAGVGFSPMTGMNSGVSLAASLHVGAAFRCLGVEANPFENPLVSDLVHGVPAVRNGVVEITEQPGLGIEVDERFARKNSA